MVSRKHFAFEGGRHTHNGAARLPPIMRGYSESRQNMIAQRRVVNSTIFRAVARFQRCRAPWAFS